MRDESERSKDDDRDHLQTVLWCVLVLQAVTLWVIWQAASALSSGVYSVAEGLRSLEERIDGRLTRSIEGSP